MLKLRRFTYRDHSAIWLVGSRADIAGLLRALQKRQRDEDRRIPIEEVVEVENPEGVRLFAVSDELQQIENGEFHWPCLRTPDLDSASIKLARLVQAGSFDESFDLRPAPAQLLVEIAKDAP